MKRVASHMLELRCKEKVEENKNLDQCTGITPL